ncbi:MAG TPA: divalent-cation tolerance protein CutA [Stenomitos sp.]
MLNVVLSTAPADAAPAIAERIVSERLAACCNIVPKVESYYWWEGKVTHDAEALLIFKTPNERVPELTRRLQEVHPYEVPEILALDVASGLESYLGWACAEARPEGEQA